MKYLFILLLLPAQLSNAQCNCCAEANRQFDFWIGDWEVFNPNGKMAGTNTIQVAQDSCVLVEHWKSFNGKSTGTSFNYYNASDSTWNQTWVDNQGGSLNLKGRWNGTSMVLEENTNGTINRISWTPQKDGSVRQFWELRKAGEDTWKPLFDGIYKRKAQKR